MLIPDNIRRPPGAVSMVEAWWDATGKLVPGPVPGGQGIQSFYDANGALVETRYLMAEDDDDAVHTAETLEQNPPKEA